MVPYAARKSRKKRIKIDLFGSKENLVYLQSIKWNNPLQPNPLKTKTNLNTSNKTKLKANLK